MDVPWSPATGDPGTAGGGGAGGANDVSADAGGAPSSGEYIGETSAVSHDPELCQCCGSRVAASSVLGCLIGVSGGFY